MPASKKRRSGEDAGHNESGPASCETGPPMLKG